MFKKPLPLELQERVDAMLAEARKVNAARGNPPVENLDAVRLPDVDSDRISRISTIDCRNYSGPPEGLPELRELLARDLLGAPTEWTLVGGHSSLALYSNVVSQAFFQGLPGRKPLQDMQRLGWLAPKVGVVEPIYDRHLRRLRWLGFVPVRVPMTPDGPQMDIVEDLVRDPAFVAIVCVPQYSNFSGETYSDETVARLARMYTAYTSFLILWDLAYAVHHLVEDPPRLANIFEFCREAGTEDRVVAFGSTSKITHAGSGVACMAMSPKNLKWYLADLATREINPDKMRQLKHYRFLKEVGIERLMRRHAQVLRPRARAVYDVVQKRLVPKGIGFCNEPRGGYFICVRMPGLAKRAVEIASYLGYTFTAVDAAFVDGDPRDEYARVCYTEHSPANNTNNTEALCLGAEIADHERR